METNTSTGTNGANRKRRTAVGRKDDEGQEQVIKINEIKDSISELIDLYKIAEARAEEFSDAVTETAERGGILASTLRKFIVARAGDKFEEKKRACKQLSLLFDNAEA